jgi:hypothetical protein
MGKRLGHGMGSRWSSESRLNQNTSHCSGRLLFGVLEGETEPWGEEKGQPVTIQPMFKKSKQCYGMFMLFYRWREKTLSILKTEYTIIISHDNVWIINNILIIWSNLSLYCFILWFSRVFWLLKLDFESMTSLPR